MQLQLVDEMHRYQQKYYKILGASDSPKSKHKHKGRMVTHSPVK